MPRISQHSRAGKFSPKHRAAHPHAGQWQYIYDGRDRDPACVLQCQADGWHLLGHPQRDLIGIYSTRELALAMANARISRPRAPSTPIAGERERDAKHVNRIRTHQQQAKECRARRSGIR
jgi:hypothetical protein